MPVYEYVCANCHSRFEALRPIGQADAPIACEHCASKKTKRVLSVFSAVSGGKPVAGTGGGCNSCHSSHCGSCKS